MNDIKVSVIIPIYNVEEYIEECLQSVINQTLDGIEVILIDDDSPDGSTIIAKRYAEQYENFTYVWQKNGGQGNARNNGVKYAHGEYLTFLDPDDIIPEHAYERMYDVAHNLDKDIVTGLIVRFDSKRVYKSRLHVPAFNSYAVETDIFHNNGLLYDTTSTNKLIRKTFWEETGLAYPEGMLYEDIPLSVIMYCSTRKVGVIHDVCYLWRAREGKNKSVTQNRSDTKNFIDRLKAIKIVDDYFKEMITDEELIESKNYKWLFADFRFFLNRDLVETDEQYSFILSEMKKYISSSIPERIIKKLPSLKREIYTALLQGDFNRVALLRDYEASGKQKSVRILNDGNNIIGEFPKELIDNGYLSLNNNFRMQDMHRRVQKIEFDNNVCIVRGYALMRYAATTKQEPQSMKAWLYKESHDKKYSVDIRIVPSENAQKKFGMASDGTLLNDYTYSGFEITIDIEKVIAANNLEGEYTVLLDYENKGIHRQAMLAGGTDKFKEKANNIYGAWKDNYISFHYDIGGVLRINIDKKAKKTPYLAMHSLFTKFRKNGSKLQATGYCIYKFRDERGKPLKPEKLQLLIGNNESCGRLAFAKQNGRKLAKGICINRYAITIDEKELTELDVQNKIQISYGETVARIGYSVLDRSKGKFKTSRILKCGELACYLKQSVFNGMYLTIREPQTYDERPGRIRSWFAWVLAKLWPKKNLIYLFEKECSRYEESASVLYEKLIDEGYDNVCYIVNRDNPAIRELDEKYKKNLVYKDSFGHLIRFFKSKVFIGSETMAHAMQLRASDKRIARKTESRDISYVFLQHGVMYMVSLNADLRVSFRQKGLNLYRVVVSSELEADHFVNLAGFDREELYVTGLATFDKSIRYDDADRIVIMPTWRRWENNQARQDFSKTGYNRMIERMVEAVPERLQDKIVILPHPLMQQAMNEGNSNLKKYLAKESHDLTLRKCDLLITDYSSIAYDAYYRGSNVIFYWEEKDYCMKKYGEETKLMLTEELAFGDVCYDADQLAESIEKRYGTDQTEEDINKYRNIVKYHDGRNAERIIELLKKDRVL